MSRVPPDQLDGPLSRKRTAELLNDLRHAAKEARVLNKRAEVAQQAEPEAALRLLRKERRRKPR